MLDKLKENKGKIIGHFCGAVTGAILAGIVGTFFGEKIGYGAGIFYLYGLFGHHYIAGLLEKRVK